ETPSPWLVLSRGWLLAMLERSDEARRVAEEANARLREQDDARWGELLLAMISALAGDYDDASRRQRLLCEWLGGMEQLGFLEVELGRLGRWLCMLGRFDEAEQAADHARALEETLGMPVPDYLWRQVLARAYAHGGELEEAERLALEAVAASE